MSDRHQDRVHKILATLAAAVGVIFGMAAPALAALPDTSDPTLELDRTIRTTPFAGSSVSMKDNEGSAYVPRDNSLWLADDNGKAIYEINPTTGALKRTIPRATFNVAVQLGGGQQAGTNRTNDFEAIAYDETNDHLYVFSGPCCTSSTLPAVFRLTRTGGSLQVESFQPLGGSANYTAAAWNPADGKLYVGQSQQLRPYDYATNTPGQSFSVGGLAGITGLDFSDDGADLFVVTSGEKLMRVRWSTKTLVNSWTFDLKPFKVLDSRAVELIGDQFYVSDGAGRTTGDPLRFAVFVFSVTGPVSGPTASFTASPSSGQAPLSVQFTDTSSGSPTTWEWDFETDGTVDSTQQSPTHVYDTPGTYTATLTVTNTSGSDSATRQIDVTGQPPPSGNLVGNPGFDVNTAGWSVAGSGGGVTLARIEPGRDGTGGAARLANGSSSNRKCVLNDDPNWVSSTTAGTYTASIWVKGEVAGALIRLKLAEMNGSTVVGSRSKTITLTTAWTQITVARTITSPGSSLDLQTFVPYAYAPPGTCFFADDASITKA